MLGLTKTLPLAQDGVCVVIAAYNEALLIRRCLESVIRAGVSPEHIYVVDDVSTDDTAAIGRRVPGVNVIVNDCKRGKLGSVRHAQALFGLAERYSYFAILDADSHVGPDYFGEVIARFLESDDTVLVCGAPHSERYNWLTAYRAYEYAVMAKLYRQGQDAMGVITVAPGCASVYRTHILNQLDWESRTLVEDMDLTVQIHRQGLGRVVYTPHAMAFTQDPKTIRDYIGQLTRWYRGTWQVMRLRRVPFGRQRIDAEFALLLGESLFFSLLTVCLPVLALLWPTALGRAIVIDQALALVLAVACSVRLRRLDILKSFVAFPLLRFITCVVLLRSFWCEVVRQQHCSDWFSPRRYADAHISTTADIAHV